jgi:hypothetical protein
MVTRLGIFTKYFSNEFLSCLLERRREEMERNWSNFGHGMKLDINTIKRVIKKIFSSHLSYLMFT